PPSTSASSATPAGRRTDSRPGSARHSSSSGCPRRQQFAAEKRAAAFCREVRTEPSDLCRDARTRDDFRGRSASGLPDAVSQDVPWTMKGCLMEIINLGQADGLPPVDWAAVAGKLAAGSAPAPDAANSRTTWLSTVNDDGSASGITAPFNAPSQGPPPWNVYRVEPRSAIVTLAAEPGGLTRFRF